MNKHLFSQDLNGRHIAQSLLLCAKILQIVAIVLAVLLFVFGTFFGITNSLESDQEQSLSYSDSVEGDREQPLSRTEQDLASQASMTTMVFSIIVMIASWIGSAYILISLLVLALLLKALAAIVLHTYISAQNTDQIADNTKNLTVQAKAK